MYPQVGLRRTSSAPVSSSEPHPLSHGHQAPPRHASASCLRSVLHPECSLTMSYRQTPYAALERRPDVHDRRLLVLCYLLHVRPEGVQQGAEAVAQLHGLPELGLPPLQQQTQRRLLSSAEWRHTQTIGRGGRLTAVVRLEQLYFAVERSAFIGCSLLPRLPGGAFSTSIAGNKRCRFVRISDVSGCFVIKRLRCLSHWVLCPCAAR